LSLGREYSEVEVGGYNSTNAESASSIFVFEPMDCCQLLHKWPLLQINLGQSKKIHHLDLSDIFQAALRHFHILAVVCPILFPEVRISTVHVKLKPGVNSENLLMTFGSVVGAASV